MASSMKYYRRIVFHKETPNFVKQQVEDIKRQILQMVPTKTVIEGIHYSISSVFSLTIIDGKTCSMLSNTASQNCHICGASPKIMNDLDALSLIKGPKNQNSLHFGISSLHAWIKCMESVLRIAYRLDIKSWRIKKMQKTATEAKKKEVQEKLRREMNILIDLLKQGYGSSNTGNVAKVFFQNPELASEVT
ncbi:hypothetical protein J437_LFUL010257 [Ladona fulva]|uniref:Uncharacterized protein n=1 Tax=Ladona fulva TaxID=123851 RepID=A0A8K0KBE9_LADFU|nr:hypothetical protein J437_LFUL010257 [Ladona fulva]